MGVAITTLLFHASLNQIGMSKHSKNAAPDVGFPTIDFFLRSGFGRRGGVPFPHQPRWTFAGFVPRKRLLRMTKRFLAKLKWFGNRVTAGSL
jgi:hypothetical protein